jgi:hypothetical protein
MSGLAGTLLDMIQSVSRVGELVASGIDARVSQLRAALRAEVRRMASSLALALLAAACGFAAFVFGAIAILVASWDSHPALASALIGVGFALIAVLALFAVRAQTR